MAFDGNQFLNLLPMLIKDLVQVAIANDGVTYNPMYCELNPSVGYMVSIKGFEEKHRDIDDDIVFGYINKHLDELCPTNYIGIWKDGVWYLDISIHILDRELAIKVGQKNEQKAIWDCAKAESIYLSSVKQ